MQPMKDLRSKAVFVIGLLLMAATLVFFVSGRLKQPQALEADLKQLEAELFAGNLLCHNQAGTEALLKRNFDLLPSDYEEALYIAPLDFMDVDELLLIRLGRGTGAKACARP